MSSMLRAPRPLRIFVVLWLLCAAAAVHAGEAARPSGASGYPIDDPLAATVVGTPDAYKAKLPSDIGFSIRELDPLVERDTPPTLRYARPLQVLLVEQSKPAPLAFVIAGTGASALSSKCVLLSRALYAVGYSVACLPSPTSVTFMLGAATHPVPGRMPADVADLYRLMQAVRDDLADEIDITGYALTGWSLGATEAAFVARHDARVDHGAFDFKHVLLINPAVSIWDSVQRMDRLLAQNLPGGIAGIPAFVARGLGGLKQIYDSGQPLRFNEDFLYRAYQADTANRQDLAAIVGLAFRLAVADMAFAADVITHADVIVPRNVRLGPYDSLDPYIKRSFAVSFADYIDELLLPYWNEDGRSVSRAQLIAEANLHRIRDFLARDPRIAVFTNADDPILSDDEVAFLRATFGDRARIRDHGGHLGNLAYTRTIDALQHVFSP